MRRSGSTCRVRPLVRWVAVLLVLVVAGVFTIGRPSAAQDPVYRLDSGDRLRVTVFGHEDLSGEFEVGGSGVVSLPLVGVVAVGGLSVPQAEEAITEAFKPDYLKNPRVNVEVLNYRPFYILGEVRSPGGYPYVSGMRVINAIALAGGFTYRAKESAMTITRSGRSSEKLAAETNTFVLPGDIIEVPERFF